MKKDTKMDPNIRTIYIFTTSLLPDHKIPLAWKNVINDWAEEKEDFYEELIMNVEIEGSYSQLVLFLSQISKLKRKISIGRHKITYAFTNKQK